MKKMVLLCLSGTIVFAFILTSCAEPRYLRYTSTGHIQHKSDEIRTEMKYMNDMKNDYFSFGLISAIDIKSSQKIPYLLFAPKYTDLETGLENCMLRYATTLPPKQAEELSKAIDKTLLEWDNKQDKGSGVFFEFMSTPISEIYEKNISIDVWLPSFKFMFNQSLSGSYASIFLGERKVDGKMLPVMYKLSKKGLTRFRTLLQEAIDDMTLRSK